MVRMPRPPLPSDDLYARLGVPADASVEAIEIAWRGLLRRHHPDVAGDEGLEVAKRINVAHDWLSDPALRARYDRERGLRHAVGPRGDGQGGRWHARSHEASDGDAPPRSQPGSRPRPHDPDAAIRRFLERVATLTPTDVDRLVLAEPPPIAFGATIRRFLPPAQRTALDDVEARIAATLPPGADRPTIRDAIDGYATELVLGSFLDELLTEPFRSRAHERLTRGWDAAVDRPRYGPNGPGVEAFLRRLGGLDPTGVARLASTGVGLSAEDPWPGGLTPEDDDGLRVSSALAGRDAQAVIPSGADGPAPPRARRAAARLAHLLVLRHAFAPATFADQTAPWRPWLLPPDAPPARVRRPARSS
jgi:DnaJ domain